jgi:hypothetical protein
LLSEKAVFSRFADAGAMQRSYFGRLERCARRPTQSLAIYSSVGQARPRPLQLADSRRTVRKLCALDELAPRTCGHDDLMV